MNTRRVRGLLIAALLSCSPPFAGAKPTPRIQVLPRDPAPRVDVLVQGKPFTSYVYLRSLGSPILEPVRAANGTIVTRDASKERGAGAQAAEQAGFWFRHADVNGMDFSGAERPDNRERGTIVHRRVIEATSSDERGRLGVEAAWMGPGQTLTLVESTWFGFGAGTRSRSIDRITRLTAMGGPVHLRRNPDGQVGIRLAAAFLDRRAVLAAAGGQLDRASLPGTRARWLAVSTAMGPEQVTVALLDHPHNPGFPTAWRLDDSGSLECVPGVDVTIDAGRSVTLRHSLVILSGRLDAEAVEREYQAFTAR